MPFVSISKQNNGDLQTLFTSLTCKNSSYLIDVCVLLDRIKHMPYYYASIATMHLLLPLHEDRYVKFDQADHRFATDRY